ncbi:MAG TPA: hypothetical protein VFG14_01100 [Chthoniobacteraceae bacterium]|jgi:hypothetical protein|nr:hypothetical protein [Chthoniobacteraceae bacterium]
MAKPSIYWLQKAAETLGKISPIAGTILGFIAWTYNIIEIVIIGTIDFIADKLTALDVSAFSNANFASLQWIGYLNAVFPLSEYLAILSAYYVAWGVVVLIRWVKSFVPTMGN